LHCISENKKFLIIQNSDKHILFHINSSFIYTAIDNLELNKKITNFKFLIPIGVDIYLQEFSTIHNINSLIQNGVLLNVFPLISFEEIYKEIKNNMEKFKFITNSLDLENSEKEYYIIELN
jgi:hypothetical protein